MLAGGVAFLFPIKACPRQQRYMEFSGLIMILGSCVFISKVNAWPGFLAAIPVIGTLLVIAANRQQSIITNNFAFQLIGKWSYSIYLWHWPIVVALTEFELLSGNYIIAGIATSIVIGGVSYHVIEKRTWLSKKPQSLLQLLLFKPF
jgi:peptidoglycan/LPS O-acetylase OafA/YrhL